MMSKNGNSIDFDSYTNDLEQMLEKLREEICTISKPNPENNPAVLTELDHYIYELNKFYYKSFHERFFPEYRKKLKEDFSLIMKVSRQEDLLKKDIMTGIKRYARLFNQVKTLTALLSRLRRENNSRLLSSANDNDFRTFELLYALEELKETIQILFAYTENLNAIAQNEELLKIAAEYPGYLSAIKLISSLDITEPLISASFNKLLIHLQYVQKLLTKLQTVRTDYKTDAGNIITAIEENMLQFSQIHLPDKIRGFYDHHISSQLTLYLKSIKFSVNTNDIEQVKDLALSYEKCISRWLIMLGKKPAGVLNDVELFSSVVGLAQTDKEYLTELLKDIHSTLQKLDDIINQLADTNDPDFNYFISQTVAMLDFAVPLFHAISTEPEINNISPLTALINRVKQNLAFLKMKIELLNEKNEHASSLNRTLSAINNILDYYLQLLDNIRADLERLLAPHNISRVWKDINIKIDHISITAGDIFPADYIYLLDKYEIETRISEDIGNTVLHEEGDIFIIRIDDYIEEEIPYLIVAEKG